MRRALLRLVVLSIVALMGYFVGWVGGSIGHVRMLSEEYPFLAERVPLPHHVPEHAGGVSFRFAMVHDVLLERYPKHGPAYYRERDRLGRFALAKLKPGDPNWLAAMDDLAVGVERLGRSDEAATLMREKLARQLEDGLSGRELYTSYANLGTFLIHGSFGAARAGDSEALARLREGVDFVRKSVEVNPVAHFGRERWQAAIAEFLLAAMNEPALLATFDCLGNRLDADFGTIFNREQNFWVTGYGRPYDIQFSRFDAEADVPGFFEANPPLDDPNRWGEFAPIRSHIIKVGAESGWDAVPVPSHRKPVPFDEPTLGIIGMWRQGGGANPHFALALGETMLRVGQRYLSWEAFERASRMADRFWPGEAERAALRDHCKARQAAIVESLRPTDDEARATREPIAESLLRSRFDAELGHGESYQRDYQSYEAARIAEGVPIDDEHFYDDFEAGRLPIATRPGAEEWYVGVPRRKISAYMTTQGRAWGCFIAGVGAMGTALVFAWRDLRRRRV